ncbi:MAG: hypothetical protein KDB27_28360 [Planctomycetales bacterium]|nr:hypothetical protein [Planctomycetales bacterium]
MNWKHRTKLRWLSKLVRFLGRLMHQVGTATAGISAAIARFMWCVLVDVRFVVAVALVASHVGLATWLANRQSEMIQVNNHEIVTTIEKQQTQLNVITSDIETARKESQEFATDIKHRLVQFYVHYQLTLDDHTDWTVDDCIAHIDSLAKQSHELVECVESANSKSAEATRTLETAIAKQDEKLSDLSSAIDAFKSQMNDVVAASKKVVHVREPTTVGEIIVSPQPSYRRRPIPFAPAGAFRTP